MSELPTCFRPGDTAYLEGEVQQDEEARAVGREPRMLSRDPEDPDKLDYSPRYCPGSIGQDSESDDAEGRWESSATDGVSPSSLLQDPHRPPSPEGSTESLASSEDEGRDCGESSVPSSPVPSRDTPLSEGKGA